MHLVQLVLAASHCPHSRKHLAAILQVTRGMALCSCASTVCASGYVKVKFTKNCEPWSLRVRRSLNAANGQTVSKIREFVTYDFQSSGDCYSDVWRATSSLTSWLPWAHERM